MKDDLTNATTADLAVLILSRINRFDHGHLPRSTTGHVVEMEHLISLALLRADCPLDARAKLMDAQTMLILNRPEHANLALREAFKDFI